MVLLLLTSYTFLAYVTLNARNNLGIAAAIKMALDTSPNGKEEECSRCTSIKHVWWIERHCRRSDNKTDHAETTFQGDKMAFSSCWGC